MHQFIYKRLTTVRDPEISNIAAAYRLPSISQFISIADNYFDYVTSGANVFFYKVYENGRLVGTTHLETQSDTLFSDIVVLPDFQGQGIGAKILSDIQNDVFGLGYKTISVSIDEKNLASIRMFEKAGFVFVSQDEELRNYVYRIGE